MSLPSSFSGNLGQDIHQYFRNICIEFKKTLKTSEKDIEQLQWEMERFLNVSKQFQWNHKTTGKYHKEEGEKACGKVWTEFKRYLFSLPGKVALSSQDLIDALTEVEHMVERLK